MKKIIIIIVVVITVIISALLIYNLKREEILIYSFEKSNSSQDLFNVVTFYQNKNDYKETVKYSRMLLFEPTYSVNDVNLENTEYEFDAYDLCMEEYIIACAHVYNGEEYIEKIVEAYPKFNNYGYALSGVHDSVLEYYTITSDVDVCIKVYDSLYEKATHVVTKRELISDKLSFLSDYSKDTQLIKECESLFEKCDEDVHKNMDEAKQNGIDVVEYNNSIKP